MNHDADQEFGLDWVSYIYNNPPHVTCLGNIVYLANSSLPPLKITLDMPSKEILLHHLKRGLQHLKEENSERSEELYARQARGEMLSPDNTNWLDFSGNLVSEQLVVNNLTTLA
ncbi:uncharacterized protein MELLADRAFT_67648 [Melampsora larici-populina 98AG31]|uniref:Uncharacterized protein n=1 Tax=Melampsora larici-populina (strain 98AG31 / pathotype 3-4-7) TaxID=747676 RepID=F4S3X7_MELLP|nr:uncharacterized protein MELLADRAFT_67648 [Melampsora larici-populina 98AG31]EGG00610.1 hypothetical protein MELLADRAFT_67648 [Melampsora larici-populina 98AG31]